MLARKIVLGLGLAVLIPALVYQGIELIKPRPNAQQILRPGQQPVLTADGALQSQADRRQLQEKQTAAGKKWSRVYFFIAVPVGVAVTLLGSFIPIPGFGGGLMLGGIFTFLNGYALYLNELGRLGNFLVLLVALAVLIWIGLKGFSEIRQAKQNPAAS